MNNTTFQQAVAEICVRDPRYAAESYFFLREALDFTVKSLSRSLSRGRNDTSPDRN